MRKFNVQVVQDYLVRREITVAVEAASMDAALDFQAASDAPAYDDPRWKETRSLQHEGVYVASAPRRNARTPTTVGETP